MVTHCAEGFAILLLYGTVIKGTWQYFCTEMLKNSPQMAVRVPQNHNNNLRDWEGGGGTNALRPLYGWVHCGLLTLAA